MPAASAVDGALLKTASAAAIFFPPAPHQGCAAGRIPMGRLCRPGLGPASGKALCLSNGFASNDLLHYNCFCYILKRPAQGRCESFAFFSRLDIFANIEAWGDIPLSKQISN